MPAILAPALLAGAVGGIGFAGGAITFSFVSAAVAFAGSLVTGALGEVLKPKPKTPDFTGGLSVQTRERTQMIRQPITEHRIVLGEVRASGPITFIRSKSSNAKLHLLLTLAAHPIDEIVEVYFGDEEIPGLGNPVTGRWSGYAATRWSDGVAGSVLDENLLARMRLEHPTVWTADHRQTGHAKAFVEWNWKADLFPGPLPNVSFVGRWALLYDPRDGGQSFATPTSWTWTNNWALAVAHYLTSASGFGATESEIDWDLVEAAANIADEIAAVKADARTATVSAATDAFTLTAGGNFSTGDRVTVTSSGSVPTGVTGGDPYYWVRTGSSSGKVATSLANARAGTTVDLSSAGSGTITVTKTGEPRYRVDGVIDTARPPKDILAELLASGSGYAVFEGGKWRIYAGAYRAPTVTLSEADLDGPIEVQTRLSRRVLFNGLRGVYVSPDDFWQPTDAPAVQDAAALAADQGEPIWDDRNYGFVTSSAQTQRLMRIDLARRNRPITVTAPFNLKAFKVRTGHTMMLDNDRFGWSGKVFEVVGWSFAVRGEGDAPALGIDLTLREHDSGVYSYDTGTEVVTPPAPASDLPNPFSVLPPGPPTVTETLYDTRDGGGVKVRADLAWAASADAFLTGYEPAYRLVGATDWSPLALTTQTVASAFDLAPGLYQFGVIAVNTLGVRSDIADAVTVKEIRGLAAPPAAPTGLTISAAGGLAVLRVQPTTDLDVSEGGYGVFRHSPAVSGALWAESHSIGDVIPGNETVALLPLVGGSYLMKWVDQSGNESVTFASVSTKQATALEFANIDTLAEHPLWTGGKTDVAVEDGDLKLAGADDIDDWGDVDDIDDWDAEGGLVASGVYDFATGYDHGSVGRFRATADLSILVFNALDLIDSRSGNIDDWEDFDGTGDAAPADVQLWARETDDDPSGSPTWGAWQRLDSAEFNARALDFQLRLVTADPAYNVRVSACGISIDEVA